ncbi:uncharacterized protein LOC123866969 [Maniola jurtina]|uniref:uncharacterized protein LOC123866969 n=1 Tax=Maniola jurtina TaxID=191418 RepID=UPI001E68EA0C|nr:uncharacterized protein LOC123866969 [Maniola jurtina]
MSNLNDDMRFNIEFVKEIERHPCIYNNKHGEYNNKPSIDKAWKTVGEKFVGLTANEIRIKWRSIRSSYSRSQRTKKEYYLSPYMDYLLPFIRTKSKDNAEDDVQIDSDLESNDDSGSQSEEDCVIEIEPTKCEEDSDKDDDCTEYNGKIQVRTLPELKLGHSYGKTLKIKGTQSKILSNYSQYTTSRLSPYECFLKSLIPDVSSMNERQFFNFRRGILNIIGKVKYSKAALETES